MNNKGPLSISDVYCETTNGNGSVTVSLMVPCYLDTRSNSRANEESPVPVRSPRARRCTTCPLFRCRLTTPASTRSPTRPRYVRARPNLLLVSRSSPLSPIVPRPAQDCFSGRHACGCIRAPHPTNRGAEAFQHLPCPELLGTERGVSSSGCVLTSPPALNGPPGAVRLALHRAQKPVVQGTIKGPKM